MLARRSQTGARGIENLASGPVPGTNKVITRPQTRKQDAQMSSVVPAPAQHSAFPSRQREILAIRVGRICAWGLAFMGRPRGPLSRSNTDFGVTPVVLGRGSSRTGSRHPRLLLSQSRLVTLNRPRYFVDSLETTVLLRVRPAQRYRQAGLLEQDVGYRLPVYPLETT
jgi:hypothetical protein